jgi:hypothetical protein
MRTQEGKIDPQNRKERINFMFKSAGCSLSWLEASPVFWTSFMSLRDKFIEFFILKKYIVSTSEFYTFLTSNLGSVSALT